MTSEKYTKELKSLGYRLMKSGVYGKPVGFNLFTFEIDTLLWTNWFKSVNGETMLIWNTDTYEVDETVKNDFLTFLKYCEGFTKISYNSPTNFEFLTTEEEINLML